MLAIHIHRWRRQNPDKGNLVGVIAAISAACCLIGGLMLAL
jgi:hypothetical protein